MKTTTVRHPRFSDVTRDVPTKDVSRWVAAGWLADEPKRPNRPKSKHTKVSEDQESSE